MTRGRAVRRRFGWRRLSAPGDKCSACWEHVSGVRVRHCGHPTANWPYYIDLGAGRVEVDKTGRGFRLLVDAMEAVEAAAVVVGEPRQ